jgi:hypothetical protein
LKTSRRPRKLALSGKVFARALIPPQHSAPPTRPDAPFSHLP